jgi:hypothetical protein
MSASCGHWDATAGRVCGAVHGVRLYLPGLRCPTHAPAALAGHPEAPTTPTDPGESTMELRTALPAAFRVLITGSRTWNRPQVIAAALAELHGEHGDRLTVVHGACPRGADAIADAWCNRHRVPAERHPADWALDGKTAGRRRNAVMVSAGADLCLAFIRNASPGASHCAELAERAGIRTDRHEHHDQKPTTALRADPRKALLHNAVRYAEHGWPVFLLGRTKRPLANCDLCRTVVADHDAEACPCLTCHGFYAATTDPERLTAMCTANPGGMLAIRTGTVSGLAVVDIDPRNGGALDPALMPRTACVATGGGGWHLYYRHPGGTLAPAMTGRPGVDVKADGGYVVAPPSIHPGSGQPYRWIGTHRVVEMAPPLADACRPIEAPTVTAPTGPTPTRRAAAISAPDALLASILAAVDRAPKGGHRHALYGAARGVARMVAAGAITAPDAMAALTVAGRAAHQTDREIREAIKGGFQAEHVATEGVAA